MLALYIQLLLLLSLFQNKQHPIFLLNVVILQANDQLIKIFGCYILTNQQQIQ